MRTLPCHTTRSLAILLLCLLVSTPITPIAQASVAPGRYTAIDAYVRERMKATHTPGLAYAVVGASGILHQRSWGTDGRGKPVTPRTPFVWGSLSKPIAATAIMTLVQSGRLGLDDRVVDHVPEFRFGGAAHASKVTVRHLLAQTAGLPEQATYKVTDDLGPGSPRPAERLGALDGLKPLGAPGTRYAYTSANYLILAAVVESVTGRPFADYLRSAVLAPAGMDGAIPDAASARNLPPGHQLLWGFPSAVADEIDHHGASYGYLGGDLNDLAAFASLQLRQGRGVLTPESVRLMRTEGRLQPTGEGTGYGLGWRVGGLDTPLDKAIWHTGASPGYSAMLFLLPERNVALVLHQNLYGILQDGAVMQVGFGAARLVAGGTPAGSPSASTYYLAIWGITALTLALLLAAVRSGLLLRRPPVPSSTRRRITTTAAWTLVGVVPLLASALLIGSMGLRPLMVWLPDVCMTLSAAVIAGTATLTLRLVLAFRR